MVFPNCMQLLEDGGPVNYCCFYGKSYLFDSQKLWEGGFLTSNTEEYPVMGNCLDFRKFLLLKAVFVLDVELTVQPCKILSFCCV